MDLNEIKTWIEANKSDASVSQYLEGFNPLAALKDPKEAHGLVESHGALKAYRDSFVTRSLDTYREKTLPGLIDEEMKKRHPEETPEQKRIRELELKIEAKERREQESARKETLRSKAKELGFDPDLAADFAFLDEEAATAALSRHSEAYKAHEKRIRNELLAKGNPPPDGGDPGAGAMNPKKFLAMSMKEQGDWKAAHPKEWEYLQAHWYDK
jgi:hypothetical protein